MKFRKIVTPAALLLAVPLFAAVQGPSGRAGTPADAAAITDPGPQAPAEGVAASLSSARPGTPDYRAVCTTHPAPGQATCLALVRTDVRPSLTAPPSASPYAAYGPPNFQAAYNLPSSSAGSGQTVAIVDAYNDPNAARDLAYYRSHYGLPPANLTIVNQNGQTSPLPLDAGSNGWASEESLDLDMVSAICPHCKILLVETDDNYFNNLGTGVNTAVSMGAGYVSNSYGGTEATGESALDTYYDHPGVAVTVSAGDDGYGVEYPAASQYVTAVGGTSLRPASNARGWTETVWGSPGGGKSTGTGSGCSGYESKPAWQSDRCANRTVADVAADADPDTGAYVYDTYDQAGGWTIWGGTSESSPIIASVYALAAGVAPGDLPSSYPYADANRATDLNDVTSGSNGSCSPAYLCNGEPGYDGPTGLGTPNGVGAFRLKAATVVYSGTIRLTKMGYCLDDRNNSSSNGAVVQVWRCTGGPNQVWQVMSDGTIRHNGLCLDAAGGGTANGTKVDLWACGTGNSNQQWNTRNWRVNYTNPSSVQGAERRWLRRQRHPAGALVEHGHHQ